MKNFKKLSLTAISLALLSSPALAATYVVNSTLDLTDGTPGDGICAIAGSTATCTLRAAIAEATTDGDIITLPSGTYAISSELSISNSITINGTGTTRVAIDGSGLTRVFNFTDTTGTKAFSIDSVQIQNGLSTDGLGGGAILMQSGTLSVANMTFFNNKATGSGGAINNKGTMTVNRSTFFSNQASSGAAIANATGATLTSTYSTFSQNISNTATATGAIDNVGTFIARTTVLHNTQNCSGTGTYNSLGFNLWSTSSTECSFTNGTLLPDYPNQTAQPFATVLSGTGQTQVLAHAATSFVVDLGESTCTGFDQIGTVVPQNTRCDLGALEKIFVATTTTTTTTTTGGNDDDDDDHDDDDDDNDNDDDDNNVLEGIGSTNLLFIALLLMVRMLTKFSVKK